MRLVNINKKKSRKSKLYTLFVITSDVQDIEKPKDFKKDRLLKNTVYTYKDLAHEKMLGIFTDPFKRL